MVFLRLAEIVPRYVSSALNFLLSSAVNSERHCNVDDAHTFIVFIVIVITMIIIIVRSS